MTRFTLFAIAAVALLAAASAQAESQKSRGRHDSFVSVSVEPTAGRRETLVKVPSRQSFVLTQACVQHSGMAVEIEGGDGRLNYGGRGCTYFRPGFLVDGGETLECVNGSGVTHSCAIVGMLRDDMGPAPRHGKLIDVEEALRGDDQPVDASLK